MTRSTPAPLGRLTRAELLLMEPAERRLAVLREAEVRDLYAHRAHVLAAMLYFLGLGLSSSASVWGFVALAAMAAWRSRTTLRTYRYLLDDWVGWLLFAWAAVMGLAILWSPDQAQGAVEWRAFRVVFTPMMVWPVLRCAPLFVASLLVGVFGQNVVQLLQGVGVVEIPLGDGPRLRGLTHPVTTATLCMMAICWHLSAIMTARGWWRVLSALGLLAAGLGMVYTGSRGPWAAAAVAIPACVIGIAWRMPASRRVAMIGAAVAIVLALASWPFVHDIVEYRLEMTQDEIVSAEQSEIDQNLGIEYRLACWEAAWETFLEHPIGGVGTGGFQVAAAESSRGDVLTDADHAHSLYLHVLAGQGLLGALVLALVVVGALSRAWRDRWDHPYAAGSFYALLGLLIAACFDAIHLSGQMLGVFVALVTVTLPTRPPASVRISDGPRPAHQHDA